ncbi:hypothetical protein Tco_1127918 [Tanacetum coccineum]
MLSSIVDAFVKEHDVGSVGVNGDEGVVGTGTFVTGNSPMQNIIVTPTCRSFKVIDRTRNVTAGPEVATNSLNPVQSCSHNMVNTLPFSYFNVVSPPSSSLNNSANKDGGEHVSNEIVNEFPSSYATKLSLTFLNRANILKLKANVPNDADCDVWLPLASVHDVNDRTKNSLYVYFISKRLAFPVVNGLCETIGKSMDLKKVTMVKGFFFFKFSSMEGHDFVLHNGS